MDKIKFEDAMEQLEEIVNKLEGGEIPLEESVDYYEKGMKLAKICSEKLESVQKRIDILVKEQGELREVPFDVDEE